jgi:hypothetical protein
VLRAAFPEVGSGGGGGGADGDTATAEDVETSTPFKDAHVHFIGRISDSSNPDDYYNEIITDASIIVTTHPDTYESDYRTWESFAAGACVFMPTPIIPVQPPFVDGQHCIFFDPAHLEHLITDIRALLDNDVKRCEIASRGQAFVKQFHNSTTRAHLLVEDAISGAL